MEPTWLLSPAVCSISDRPAARPNLIATIVACVQVFELMSLNLYELIRGRKRYLSRELVKIYAWQLMRGLAHMHSKGVFHR